MKDACTGCAFTPGSAANREPQNALKAEFCLLAGMPFFCHHDKDWKNPEQHKLSRREAIALGYRICGGWARLAKELGATGYYGDDLQEKRFWAQHGVNLLSLFISTDNEEEKEETRKELQSICEMLFRERSKFGITTEERA